MGAMLAKINLAFGMNALSLAGPLSRVSSRTAVKKPQNSNNISLRLWGFLRFQRPLVHAAAVLLGWRG